MAAFLVVGFGGFLGSCLRYALTKLFPATTFPVATLLANVLAGFLIGLIIGCGRRSSLLTPTGKLFLTTGFLGGLSTFSTFSLETVTLFESGKVLLAAGNILLNLGFSLLGTVFGLFLAGVFFAKTS